VPDLGLELHVRWPKRVLAGDLDVDMVGGTLVRCIRRPKELAAKMCQVVAVPRGLYYDLRELVVLDIGDLFGDAPRSIRRHIEKEIWAEVWGCGEEGKG
jgi:hypothetical protein